MGCGTGLMERMNMRAIDGDLMMIIIRIMMMMMMMMTMMMMTMMTTKTSSSELGHWHSTSSCLWFAWIRRSSSEVLA